MSERGVFAVDRGIFDHPKFQEDDREFSKLEAWVWMLSRAAWRPHVRVIAGRKIELKRGQFAASIRFMAEAWGWSRSRVERFLQLLETETGSGTEIETANETGITVITIRKYDEYQKVSLPRETPNETPNETQVETGAGQQRDKVENIKNIKPSAEAKASASVSELPTAESELFRRGKQILGPTAGGLIKQLLQAKEKNIALARAALEVASTKENPREYIGGCLRQRDSPGARVADPRL